MKHIQNTLYVTQEGAFVHKDGESIVIHHDHKKLAQFPDARHWRDCLFWFWRHGISATHRALR